MGQPTVRRFVLAMRDEWERLMLLAVALLLLLVGFWGYHAIVAASNLRVSSSSSSPRVNRLYSRSPVETEDYKLALIDRHAFIVRPDKFAPAEPRPEVTVVRIPVPDPKLDPSKSPTGPDGTGTKPDVTNDAATTVVKPVPTPPKIPDDKAVVEFKGYMTSPSGNTLAIVTYIFTKGGGKPTRETQWLAPGETVGNVTVESVTGNGVVVKTAEGVAVTVPKGERRRVQ